MCSAMHQEAHFGDPILGEAHYLPHHFGGTHMTDMRCQVNNKISAICHYAESWHACKQLPAQLASGEQQYTWTIVATKADSPNR